MAESEWMHDPAGLAQLLPVGLEVGVSDSALAVEGAIREDGRSPSTWDLFMAQSGRIVDGSSAAVAADRYHRHADDMTLLSELGVDSYRFSLSWPRLQPDGRGSANRAAVAFYDRVIDALLAAGIRPGVVLHDMDLPESLQHAGGWLNRDTASRFADYAYLAASAFGDRVARWTTLDEPSRVMLEGYAIGRDAPGAVLGLAALPVAHHQLLGHGLSVEALRAGDVRGGIGITLRHTPVEPSSDRADDTAWATAFDVVHNRLYADAVLLGRYPAVPEDAPDDVGRAIRSALDEVEPRDLAAIATPLDHLGIAYRGPSRVRAPRRPVVGALAPTTPPRPFLFAPWPEVPQTLAGDAVSPEHLALTLAELRACYGEKLPPLDVSLSGAVFADSGAPGDTANDSAAADDPARVAYLAEHLAVLSGEPAIRSVIVRSLLDGWEGADGFTHPSGLVRVDGQTQRRTPKRSYRFLQDVLGGRSGG